MPDGESLGSDRVKHLEFIQAVISRMAGNSFLIKGWSLTIAVAFFGVLATRLRWKTALVALVPLLAFWLLDAYFLVQERRYRALYDDARRKDGDVECFSMNVKRYAKRWQMANVLFSVTLASFYGVLLIVNLVFLIGSLFHQFHWRLF